MKVSIYRANNDLERKEIEQVTDWKTVEVLTAWQPDEKVKEVLKETDLTLDEVTLDGSDCLIAHRPLHIYNNHIPRKSATSQAHYVGRSEDYMKGMLLQYLSPHKHTSKHYHETKQEFFYGMEGNGFVEIDGEKKPLMGHVWEVNEFQTHQVSTKDDFALTLLIIKGDPRGLSLSDHVYVK